MKRRAAVSASGRWCLGLYSSRAASLSSCGREFSLIQGRSASAATAGSIRLEEKKVASENLLTILRQLNCFVWQGLVNRAARSAAEYMLGGSERSGAADIRLGLMGDLGDARGKECIGRQSPPISSFDRVGRVLLGKSGKGSNRTREQPRE
jgi:hypothetical protein